MLTVNSPHKRARSKREWKISNLKTENDKIKGKEAQEGGLTPGQASTLVRSADWCVVRWEQHAVIEAFCQLHRPPLPPPPSAGSQ